MILQAVTRSVCVRRAPTCDSIVLQAGDRLAATTGFDSKQINKRKRFIRSYSAEVDVEEYNNISFSIRRKNRGSQMKVAICMSCLHDFPKHDKAALKSHAENSCPARDERPKKQRKAKHELQPSPSPAAVTSASVSSSDAAMATEPAVLQPDVAADEHGVSFELNWFPRSLHAADVQAKTWIYTRPNSQVGRSLQEQKSSSSRRFAL